MENLYQQSERTRTYDITEISGLQYYTGHAVDGDISCSECSLERGSETCGGRGQCKVQPEIVGRGELETKTCDCDDGFLGESCQFKGAQNTCNAILSINPLIV